MQKKSNMSEAHSWFQSYKIFFKGNHFRKLVKALKIKRGEKNGLEKMRWCWILWIDMNALGLYASRLISTGCRGKTVSKQMFLALKHIVQTAATILLSLQSESQARMYFCSWIFIVGTSRTNLLLRHLNHNDNQQKNSFRFLLFPF